MTARTRTTTIVLAVMLGIAATAWIALARQTSDMRDMGIEKHLGSPVASGELWVEMMAAMMVPGAVPAALAYAHFRGHAGSALLFVGSYLAVWSAVGVACSVLYRPHGTVAAGATLIAAGVYELSPLKRQCRARCTARMQSGFRFGLDCVGASIGLMLVPVALGPMNLTSMAVVTGLVSAQKLIPARAAVDVPLALGIVAFGWSIVA